MRDMRWYIAVFYLVYSGATLGLESDERRDLTQFDFPFLLGDWYFVNANPEDKTQDYLSIRLQLSSSYMFAIEIQKRDSSFEFWEGDYTANQETLTLGMGTPTPQVYSYVVTHNQLILNGVTFYKTLSQTLVGIWVSQNISGFEIDDVGVTELLLILQPDFIFFIRVSDALGHKVMHRGIYYTENGHLVFLYELGEHDARFELDSDKMILNLEDGAMLAELNRMD